MSVQCGMFDCVEFEATRAYVTENGDFTVVPVSILTACIQCAYRGKTRFSNVYTVC